MAAGAYLGTRAETEVLSSELERSREEAAAEPYLLRERLLHELEHEGLLRGLPGGGYVVREFTMSDIRDAIELRGVLEGTAARYAVERGATRRDLKALQTINDSIEELIHRTDYESFESYVDMNQRFHARLLKMARSPMLERTLGGIVSLPFAGPSAAFM